MKNSGLNLEALKEFVRAPDEKSFLFLAHNSAGPAYNCDTFHSSCTPCPLRRFAVGPLPTVFTHMGICVFRYLNVSGLAIESRGYADPVHGGIRVLSQCGYNLSTFVAACMEILALSELEDSDDARQS